MPYIVILHTGLRNILNITLSILWFCSEIKLSYVEAVKYFKPCFQTVRTTCSPGLTSSYYRGNTLP